MTASPSIFLKICPDCAAQVPTASERCKCGHIFESAIVNELSPEEAALRDEELYENYLSARAEQANQAAQAAQAAYLDEPDNSDKAAEAELTREVSKSIGADLAEQRTKLEALRRAIGAQRPKAVLPALPPIEAPAVAPVIARPRIEPVSEIVVTKPASPPLSSLKPVKVVSSDAPALASPAAVAQKAARVLNAIKQAKAREATARSHKQKKAPAKTVSAPKPAAVPASQPPIEVSVVPPPSFRQEQAARAEIVMETRKLADTKDCPNCTASVPLNTTRCSCGFAFITGGNDLPSLTLCTGDFTALRNSLNLNLRRR